MNLQCLSVLHVAITDLLIYHTFLFREAMFEFCNNEEVKKLFIFSSTSSAGKNLVASLTPPSSVREKSVYFVKIHDAGKLSRDKIITDVAFCDSSYQPLAHASTLTKDVFLPLLSIEMGGSVSADKLMDLVHRLVSVMQVADGSAKDQVTLPLPSIEVLSEAAAYSSRRPAVIHVLETAVVNWIKQIKVHAIRIFITVHHKESLVFILERDDKT